MTGATDTQSPHGRAKASKTQNQLLAESRPLSEVKRHVNNLLAADPQIRALLPDEASANPLVRKARNDVLDELYQLLELVLLGDNKALSLPKAVLQERLAVVLAPANKDQLRVNASL